MRRIGRTALLILLGVLTSGSSTTRSDDQPKPDPKAAEAVDRILADWQAKASTITSVEVRFRGSSRSSDGVDTKREGWAVLAAPNLAFLELSSVDNDGKPVEIQDRLIWNGRSILQFDFKERIAFRYPIRKEWPDPPAPLCLPFFFRMTVEGAKRDYDWAVIREDQEQVILKASPKKKPDLSSETSASFLFLDRRTFLPKRLISIDRDGKGRQTYEAIEIKINKYEDLDGLRAPCLDAWTIKEMDDWLTRLLLK